MLIADTRIPPSAKKALAAKKIYTTGQYLDFLPKAYYDLQDIRPICSQQTPGTVIVCLSRVSFLNAADHRFTYVCREDSTGERIAVTWFHQDYLMPQIAALDVPVIAIGHATYNDSYGYSMCNPAVFMSQKSAPACMSTYRKIRGLSESMAASLYGTFIPTAEEPLEDETLAHASLRPIQETYKDIHFPKSGKDAEAAMREYRIRDMMHFAAVLSKTYPRAGAGTVLADTALADRYIGSLPYELTADQRKAVSTIAGAAAAGQRMRLLVQGDVGCGKTTVAFYAALLAIGSGRQAVIMAPTTVLAKQHYEEFNRWAQSQDIGPIAFISTETKAAERRKLSKGISDGSIRMIIGTQAVLTEEYKDLAMIIIDEEHKFGVRQRETLKTKAENGAHIISMSATPIPRSLATILYGEGCDVIAIKTMPAGRLRTKTCVSDNSSAISRHIARELQAGRQIYVVCPRVELDDKTEKKSVTEAAMKYQADFPQYKVAALHGKMKKNEIAEIIDDFKSGRTHILVSTTVVEVGVNIPNASTIVIENAEMFGLASLHQLRGRVGRSAYQGYCILKSDQSDSPRLNVMASTTDGFEIAEEDLRLRGAGQLIGLRQSGMDKYIDMIADYPDEYRQATEYAKWAMERNLTGCLESDIADGEEEITQYA